MSGLGHIRAERFPCKRFSRTKNTALGSIVANSHHKSENTVTICEIRRTGVDWLAGFKRGRSGICFRVGLSAPQEGGRPAAPVRTQRLPRKKTERARMGTKAKPLAAYRWRLCCLMYGLWKSSKLRALWIICCCKLSKGLVIAFSYCGLTSSGIEQFSCYTSPYSRTKKRACWPRRKLSGPLFLTKQPHGKL
jgi:hypothetical protein